MDPYEFPFLSSRRKHWKECKEPQFLLDFSPFSVISQNYIFQAQPAITHLKITVKTLIQGVNYVQS